VDRADIVKEGLHLAGVLASQKMLTAPKALGRIASMSSLSKTEKH